MNELNLSPHPAPVSEQSCLELGSSELPENSEEFTGPVRRRPNSGRAPLSFAQRQVWLHEQLAEGVPLYNEFLILERRSTLNKDILELSFSEVIRRHQTLRTTFAAEDGPPVPVISDAQVVDLPFTDLSGLSDTEREAEILRVAKEEVRQAFDLEHGPLLRTRLLGLAQDHYILVDGACDRR